MVQTENSRSGMLVEEKTRRPRLPVIGFSLALAALVLLAVAGLGVRSGLWHFRTGFALLTYGAWCGLAAALVSLCSALFHARARHFLAVLISLVALVIGVTVFAVPLRWKMTAQRLPRIHDITTDPVYPPTFVAILPLRRNAPNPPEYGGIDVARQQREAYPDIKTIVLDLPQAQSFARALDTAQRMGWKVVAAVPGEGRIEATDTTRWFGFTDDIVIRVTPAGNRSLVDIRSVSRVGVSDVGTNARRIRVYLEKLQGKA